MQVSLDTTNPQFKAKPSPKQMKEYTITVRKGLSALNKKVGLIIHNSSVPAEAGKNTGIGSLLSTAALATFVPFLSEHRITTIQQEPDNLRKNGDPSPYSPLTPSKNIYMIPLEKLTTGEYGKILSNRTLKAINQRASLNQEKVNFNNVAIDYDHALWEAYNNLYDQTTNTFLFKERYGLEESFNNYKFDNSQELAPQALYEILAKEYNNNDWRNWNEIDQHIFDSDKPEVIARKEALLKDNKKEINFYMFKQWLIDRESAYANVKMDENRISLLGDSPIAFTPYEEWMHKDLFLDNLALGCPPDYFSKDGQRWGFSVLKPETIFNEDGSLGKGGELLKKRYEDMFKSASGGARIDHIIGLIDPFVYTPTEPKMTETNSGRLYSSPNHPILGKYAKSTDEEYAAILEKIVIPAAEKFKLTKDDIICEDLGTVTEPVKRVMEKLGLSGIAVTEFDYRGRDTAPNKVIMLGSHDNSSFIEYTDSLFAAHKRKYFNNKTGMLAEDTDIPNEKFSKYHKGIKTDKKKFMAASFAELFTSPAKKIQIFFTDFFGIGKTYNKPGTTDGCWSLRLGEDFERLYYDNLSKGLGLNLPEAIARAIRHRGEKFSSKHTELLEKLDKFTEILKS